MAGWKVVRAGRILVAAGVLDQDYLDHSRGLISDAAIKVRYRLLLNWDRRRGMLPDHSAACQPDRLRRQPGDAGPRPSARCCGWPVTACRGRAPPLAGADAGPGRDNRRHAHALAAGRIERGSGAHRGRAASHAVRPALGGGRPGTRSRSGSRAAGAGRSPGSAWPGCHRCPRATSGGSNLVGDGTRLVQLPLGPVEARPGRRPVPAAAEPVATGLGERLLVLEAERILASGDARGPEGPMPGEIITVLTEAGAIAGSPVPGQLADCASGSARPGTASPSSRRGDPGVVGQRHRARGITGAGRRRSVRAAGLHPPRRGRGAVRPGRAEYGRGREPPARDQQRYAAARRRFQWDWTPGLSWWLKDTSGNWHVATAGEPLHARKTACRRSGCG